MDDLVKHENEHSGLDFKAVQYAKASHHELLKDVIALANASGVEIRHIVMGVKHSPSGERKLIGIEEEQFVDPAVYQQLVRENVEPHIPLEYVPHRLDDVLLGVLRIGPCSDPPYMMRKKFGEHLREGDSFVRKGSHQHRLMRSDIDRMVTGRRAAPFAGVITAEFSLPVQGTSIEVPITGQIELPSDRARHQIKAILAERERLHQEPGMSHFGHKVLGVGTLASVFGPTPYESRSDEQLKKDLAVVERTYARDDLHELFERNGLRLNIRIANHGDQYLEDVSIEVTIADRPGFVIADKVHHKPPARDTAGMMDIDTLGVHYPHVEKVGGEVRIRDHIGDLRHGMPVDAFDEPLRVVIAPNLAGERVTLSYAIRGKQLPRPVLGELNLTISGTG
jgi:hypothetical protein